MNNVQFIPDITYHIELNFSTDYTLEGIVKCVNTYLKENELFPSQTQLPKFYYIPRLCKCPSVLW